MRAAEAMDLLTQSGFLPYVTLMPKDNPRLHVPAVHKEHGNKDQQQMVSIPVIRPQRLIWLRLTCQVTSSPRS